MVMPITTVEKVKLRRGDITSNQWDALIQEFIDEVSDEAQTFLSRHLQNDGRRTEKYPIQPGRESLWVRGFPVTSVVYVKYAPTADFSTIDALDSSSYAMHSEIGILKFPGVDIVYPDGCVEISYNGGMSADTADFIAKYPRIAGAATMEVINRLARKAIPDGNAQAMGASTTYTKELHTLEDFESALMPRRRLA